MKLIQRKDIDPVKWDLRIKASAIENIFCYSWYLDAVSKNWAAIVTPDYKTIIPIPFATKLGIKKVSINVIILTVVFLLLGYVIYFASLI